MSSSSGGIDPHLLAEVAAALLDAGAADSVSRALVRGELTATSTSVRRSALATTAAHPLGAGSSRPA